MAFLSLGNLRLRLILLVLLAVLPALGVTLYSGIEQREQALSAAREKALELTQELSSAQKDIIDHTRQILFALSQLPQVQQQDPVASSTLFSRLLKHSEGPSNIVACNLSGEAFASVVPLPAPINLGDRPWFRRVLQSRDFVIGEYQVGRVKRREVVVLAYPVLDEAGEVRGVLNTALSLKWLSRFIAKRVHTKDVEISVMDRKGTVLAHFPHPEEFIGKSMAESPIFEIASTNGQGVVEQTGMNGVVQILGYTTLRKGAEVIYVTAGIPKEIAFADANRSLRRNLGTLGLVTLLALVAAWFLGDMFVVRPVHNLLRVTKEVEDGNLAARTDSPYISGELGRLARAFDQMAESLQQRELERRQVEEALRETQQTVLQQERLRALGQMASGIAHDINNALAPIVGYTDLLLQFETGLTERVRRNLEAIKMAGRDIGETVTRMRAFYRKRDEDVALTAVDLNQLVKEVKELTRPRWKDIPQEHGIVIHMATDLQTDLPFAAGAESEIRQALTNLILNAVDSMPRGGSITLRTSVNSKNLFLDVTDTGTGMDEELKRRCLDPFYTTKGERGTGLGLAMVYGIMQRHDGHIRIESEPGIGTTMRLTFPLRELPKEAADEVVDSGLHLPLRVLCIDDEMQQRRVLKGMLEHDKHYVEVIDGGQAGLEAFRAAEERGNPFDVVITDLGMPYVDGRDVAVAVKRESPATPVILLTGWGKRTNGYGETPSQVDYVASKPITVNELRKALHHVTSTTR